jgi:hypothetical protein
MAIQLAPIEGTPYVGGTATGVIYVDASGLQKTDGPTVDASGRVGINDTTPDAMLDIVCASATDVGLQVELAAAQSANALDITSNGGTAGDLFKIDKDGDTFSVGESAWEYASAAQRFLMSYDSGSKSYNLSGQNAANTASVNLTAGDAATADQPAIKLFGKSHSSLANVIRMRTNNADALVIAANQDATFSGNVIVPSPTVPSSASDTGTVGTVSWDSSFIYICTATDTWKRVAIATW